jgi:hypothetical protein
MAAAAVVSQAPVRSTTFADAVSPVVQDGDRFWRMPETYVRGNTIKYLRVPNEVRHEDDSNSSDPVLMVINGMAQCCWSDHAGH